MHVPIVPKVGSGKVMRRIPVTRVQYRYRYPVSPVYFYR